MNKVWVYIEPLENVSTDILEQFKKLNRGYRGRMKNTIGKFIRKELGWDGKPVIKNPMVFYIKDKDEVLSWGMCYRGRYDPPKHRTVDIYTKLSHRSNGYGSIIADIMKQEMKHYRLDSAYEYTTIYKRLGYYHYH